MVQHCLVVSYANYHTFLITIPHRDNRATAAAHLKADLAALCDYGHQLEHRFVSFKDIIINDFRSCIHLCFITMFVFLKLPQSGCLDLYLIPPSLGSSILTVCWVMEKTMFERCQSFFGSQDIFTLYKSCI